MKGQALAIGRKGAALMVDGRLEELALTVETAGDPLRVGAKFQARIIRRLGRDAFVDLGDGQVGFLPNADPLQPGDARLVEIARLAEGDKAARATPRLSFRSRLAVLTVGAPGTNISRSIESAAERDRLKRIFADAPDGGGFVVRSAAAIAPDAALIAQKAALEAAWAAAERKAQALRGKPGAIAAAPSAVETALADWPGLETALVVADETIAAAVRAAMASTAPTLIDRLRLASEDPWTAMDVEEAIDALLSPRVELRRGWMALERMAALIAVDVNAADGDPAAVNLAAAREIDRQLRLRGWGGMVVVDFAGDPDAAGRERLETALRRAGGSAMQWRGWGPLGLLEGVRKREGPPIETLRRPGRVVAPPGCGSSS